MGMIGRPATSVTIYKQAMSNIPQEREPRSVACYVVGNVSDESIV